MISISSETCVEGWCKAVVELGKNGSAEAYNIIIEIQKPNLVTDKDLTLIQEIDNLLKEKNKQPLHTVSQTIFPDGLYLKEGAEGFYTTYPEKVYPKIKNGRWGTYANRLVRWPVVEGDDINQVKNLVEKIKGMIASPRKFGNCYEVGTHHPELDASLFDPETDRKARMGRQCLSHLSFKVDFKSDPRRLILTALYRNHYYFERVLGNMLGLTKLMGFVATESSLTNSITSPVGPLIIHSTHGQLESVGKKKCLELAANYLDE